MSAWTHVAAATRQRPGLMNGEEAAMKKYKEEAYKGYLKFVKENRYQKIAKMAWLDGKNLRVEIEVPYMMFNKSKGNTPYFFFPETNCVVTLNTKEKRDSAKELVYSAFCRLNKELDEIGEKVEGRA